MTGRTHLLVGTNTVWLLPFVGLEPNLLHVAIGGFAALLPDLDASESMIKYVDVPVRILGVRFRIKPFYPFAVLAHALFRHRGWLHSAVAIVVVIVLSQLAFGRFGQEIPFIISAGYLSHILTDMLTQSGVQFALPLTERFRLIPKTAGIRTNGWLDHILFGFALAGLVAFFWFSIT